MNALTRRDVIKIGLAGAGTLLLRRPAFGFESSTAAREPHFFLQVILGGGADTSYMFDARPLEMTKLGKIQNFLGEDPTPWTGTNGVSCLATSLMAPLAGLKDRFSILNGVMMAPNFDGHDQNMNLFLTGSNFGGESFIPHLNLAETGTSPATLDALIEGVILASISNASSTVPFSVRSAQALRQKMEKLKPALPGDGLIDFIRSRYEANAVGNGRLSNAAKLMLAGFNASPVVQEKIKEMRPFADTMDPQQQFCSLISDSFRLGLARSAIFVIADAFDTHAADTARRQPAMFKNAVGIVQTLLKGLLETPYDNKRSMFDVTTVMITSEFSRTMRIENTPVDNTGTNHNALNNTVLLGGKGVRGGLVIGGSDTQSAGEAVSKAHLSLDPTHIKAMARPFDFSTLRSRADKPDVFKVDDYLTIASVINTIYKLFGNPTSRYRPIYTNRPIAPTLDGLLV